MVTNEEIAPGWTMRVEGPAEVGAFQIVVTVEHTSGKNFELCYDLLAVKNLMPDDPMRDFRAEALQWLRDEGDIP